jgi:hypothetical protein
MCIFLDGPSPIIPSRQALSPVNGKFVSAKKPRKNTCVNNSVISFVLFSGCIWYNSHAHGVFTCSSDQAFDATVLAL